MCCFVLQSSNGGRCRTVVAQLTAADNLSAFAPQAGGEPSHLRPPPERERSRRHVETSVRQGLRPTACTNRTTERLAASGPTGRLIFNNLPNGSRKNRKHFLTGRTHVRNGVYCDVPRQSGTCTRRVGILILQQLHMLNAPNGVSRVCRSGEAINIWMGGKRRNEQLLRVRTDLVCRRRRTPRMPNSRD